jgi:hypothetical protein
MVTKPCSDLEGVCTYDLTFFDKLQEVYESFRQMRQKEMLEIENSERDEEDY